MNMTNDDLTAADALATLRAGVDDPHALALTLLRRGLDEGSFERAVSNCHTAGVDSIVLRDDTSANLGMVRFFFARHGHHKLHQLHDKRGHFTVGVHNHRYPLALIPLNGTILNVRTELSDTGRGETLHEYKFASALADDDTEAIGTVHLRSVNTTGIDLDPLATGAMHLMDSDNLHTIVVPEVADQPGTAWMVLEGPSTNTESRIYSPRSDLRITSEELYLPLTRERAINLTEGVLRLAERG